MSKSRRTFCVEQKLQIIQEADQLGITQVLPKHNLSLSVHLRWKRGFNQGGAELLKPQYHKVDPELRVLQDENVRLKKIVGNQPLELEFKTELLTKKRSLRKETEGVLSAFAGRDVPVRKLLQWASLPASMHYYKPGDGTRGARPSTCTFNQDGELYDNQPSFRKLK